MSNSRLAETPLTDVRGSVDSTALALIGVLLLACSGCTPNATSPLVIEPGVCADTSNLFPVANPGAIPEDKAATLIYVDGARPNASDGNSGAQTAPLRTVSAAAAQAVVNNAAGIGTKVLIAPGTYREQISLPVTGTATVAPIIFEALSTGQAVISGADIFRDWTPEKQPNTYSSVWPYRWGLAPYPKGWAGNVTLDPIVRRREMVFVNDVPYTQVLTLAALVDNSFYVAEDSATLYVRTPPGVDFKSATVEVSTRPVLFHAQGKTNIVLRGLAFVRGNPPVPGSAVEIIDSSGVLVEDCQFIWNNWDGLDIITSTNVAVRRSVGDHNGASGMGGFQLKNSLYEDNETSFNNWRGAQGGFDGWAVAGSKFGALHDAVFRNYRSEYNQTRGFWLDYDDSRILIDNANWSNNLRDGVFIEANEGPILIRNSTFSKNRNGAGISGASSSDVTLAQNVISGNELSQLQITGDFDRQVTNWETNTTYTLRAERWTLSCNAIANTDKSQLFVDAPNWPHFLTTLKSQKNAWFTAGNSFPFKVGVSQYSYTDWKASLP
jgi:Right handed beta helix region